MALSDLLDLSQKRKKIGMSEERIQNVMPHLRSYIAFWREYPDMFVDFMAQGTNFKFYFYQRVFLRAAMRHQYAYCVFPRAYSKSFLTMMVMMIRCILYPGSKLFVTSGGKEQSAGIMREKIQEICTLIPNFEKEIDWGRGQTSEGKDYCKYIFKNGSYLDNIAARESSRGKRRHGGVVEECVGVDGEILSAVIIPTMNISRRCLDGTTHPEETLNKSQVYITTAGWKGTFAYEKLIQVLIWSVVKPEKAIVLGGTYKVPVLVKLLDKNFVQDLKMDGTFNENSFNREYMSKWTGETENAFFNSEVIDRVRRLNQPEYEYSGRSSRGSEYIISADVGRKGCSTIVSIFKNIPQPGGAPSHKSLVNMYAYNDVHFEDQAIILKKLYYKYKAKRLVIDGNGVGLGLVDYLIKKQVDPETGDIYPDFGVYNDDDGYYKKYKTSITEFDAIYIVKANAQLNTEIHVNAQNQLTSGRINLLISETIAKNKLMQTKVGQSMSPEQREEYLRPFVYTSMLKDEMLNLREETEGINIILKQANKAIKKDRFSSFEYGLYYIKLEEDKLKKKKRFNASDWLLLN